MSRWLRRAFCAACALSIALSVSSVLAQAAPAKAKAKPQPGSTTKPVPREGKWMDRHNSFNERVKKGDVDLLFIGDSITQGWEGAGKDVWKEFYGNRKAVNLGIGGDRTEHVLWRLDNGNIDNISPKLAVLMIGTNNSGSNTSEEIAAGVKAIVTKLRTKLPTTKVLVLAVFPRGETNADAKRQVNMKANAIIQGLADNKNVFFKDIGKGFLKEDDKLTKDIMPDLLHLSPAGYKIWAEAIEPDVTKFVGAK